MNIRVRLVQKVIALLILFLLIAGGRLFAQAGRGSISGTVTDPGGAVVPRAQVVLLNQATGVTEHTVTDSAGFYTFISLNPGEYRVTASGSGFASVARENITVTVDQATPVDIALRIGAVSEVVTVKGSPSLVEPTNSTVGQLISAATIDRVPLVYRNVYDLVQLSAGVSAVNGSPNSSDDMQSIQNISSGRPGVDVSADTFNGSLVGSVYYMVDGSPIGIAENNSAAIIPAMSIPEDAVQEVRVETQDTPASYQSGSAGVISLVTKSGTNDLHGNVFGVFRPDWLAANDLFNKESELASGEANTPPAFHRYQEGGAIGGPIKRDKLFYFGDYEDTQEVQFQGLQTYSVPTTAERTGDFSKMGFTIYDPTRPDNSDGTRQAFPGNKILNPNPLGLLYLSKMPSCNFPSPATCNSATSDMSPNFEAPGLDPLNAHKFDVRMDWAASEKQHIFTRFSYDRLDFATANVFPSGWDPDYAENVTNGRNALVGDDLTLNSTTVLQLRYSFTRHYENQGGPPAYSSTNLTDLGTVNGSTVGFPASLAAQETLKQLPFIIFGDLGGGVGGTADYNIFQYASENSDANATITKALEKHELSFGFEWMKRYLNVGQPPAPAGAYEFDVSATDSCDSCANPVGGSDFASLLVGMMADPNGPNPEPNFYPNFTKDVFAAESNPYYASFVEDTYHPWKSLTVTAGLRWDIFGGRNERYNRQEYFDPTATNTLNGDSYTGAEIYANGGNRSPFTTNLHDFGPRLAFAWQPITNFVVRAGAGMYYGPSTENVGSALINSQGFASQTIWNGTCFNKDLNTVFNGTSCGVNTGSATDVFNGPYSLSNPFPTGVVPILSSAPSGLANNLGTTLQTVLHSQRTPVTYNYNFGLEYELPYQVVVSAAYVGSKGLFLPLGPTSGAVDLNQLDLTTIAKYNNSLCIANEPSCSTASNPYAALPGAFNGQSTVPPWFVLQPYPQFGDGGYGAGNGVLVSAYPGGVSEYNSLQAKVQKELTSHFTVLSTFTWSKLMTNDGNPPLGFVGSHEGSPQDWRDLQYEWSVSPQDLSYSYSGEVSYDLPVGKGRALNLSGAPDDLLGGWTLNGVLYLSSGVPINAPSTGASESFFNQRADMVCNPAHGAPHTTAAWFNVTCFRQPGTEKNPNFFIPGNAPDYLDNVRTMGGRELDLSVFKTVNLTETKALRFDVSCYNVSNYMQWGYPSVPSLSGVAQQGLPFGQITNDVNTPRQFQFGARFTF